MGIVTVPPINAGVAKRAEVIAAIAAIGDEFNGLIDNANVKAGAAIDGSKLANASVTGTQLGTWDGWLPGSGTWTYASPTTFTAPAADAAAMGVGDKIKMTNSGTKYFYVIGISGTTITVTGGTDYTVANAAITTPLYSHMSTPVGFPKTFNYTPTVTSGSGTFTTVSGVIIFWMTGGICNLEVAITITTNGSAATSVIYILPITSAVSTGSTGAGRADGVSGKGLQCKIASTTSISMFNYDGTYPGATGEVLRGFASYPVA